MASILELIQRSFNRGLKEFRFTLSEPSEGTLVLTTSPDGWSDVDIEYFRSKEYYSCNRKGSEVDLIFYKEGKQFLQNVYENSGPGANVFFKVEKLNKATQTYEDYPTANKPDLGTYEVDEIGVSVKMLDSDFKEKVYNRDSVPLDITDLTSIDGLALSPFALDKFTIPDTSIDFDDTATVDGNINSNGDNVVPITAVTNTDFSEMRVPPGSTPNTIAASFFYNSVANRIVQLTGLIEFDLWGDNVDFTIIQLNSLGNLIAEYGIYQKTYSGADPKSDSFNINQYITLNIGDSLIFQVDFTGTKLLISGSIIVNQFYEGTQETVITGFPYYEMFLRLYQKQTDKENPFKSDFCGRTDTPLTTYATIYKSKYNAKIKRYFSCCKFYF